MISRIAAISSMERSQNVRTGRTNIGRRYSETNIPEIVCIYIYIYRNYNSSLLHRMNQSCDKEHMQDLPIYLSWVNLLHTKLKVNILA